LVCVTLLVNAGANVYAMDNCFPLVPIAWGTPLAWAKKFRQNDWVAVAKLLSDAMMGTFPTSAEDSEAGLRESAGTAPVAAADEQRARMCVVCLDAPAQHIVMPCGHLCLCSTCGVRIAEQRPERCPVCRQAAQSVTKVFY